MKTNLVIGDPIEHSLSPIIHNAAYQALGISNEFVFKAERVRPAELENVAKRMRDDDVNALAVTIPHKQSIFSLLDIIDDVATEIGAVNTVVNHDGKLVGYNTDWQGVIGALDEITDLKGNKVAILGTGGSARAVAYAMKKAGAIITIFGRDNTKVIEISKQYGAMPASIDAQSEIAECDVIINATSVGLDSATETELVPSNKLGAKQVVFDLVYPNQTKLLQNAKQAGAKAIDGLEMLLHQAGPQIELMTGLVPDIEVMRQAIQVKP